MNSKFSIVSVAIDGPSLVEDPNGSVLLVGGLSRENNRILDKIFKLSTSEDDHWELLPQKLATPRFGHTAFFVPNNVAQCN